MSKKILRIASIIIVTLILGISACYLFVYIVNKTIGGEEYLFYYPVTFTNVIINDGELEYSIFDKIYYGTSIDDDYYIGITDSDNYIYHELVEVRQEKYEIQGYESLQLNNNACEIGE